ncbi:CYTH domain-containing protein [Niallia sp. Krafla_26]|uniref:CYTH domain-containing protein n=1 Tax=Niallia sp. Krafla_26 TaxID=3064703 RepID=UPI003D1744D3
MSQSIEIEFKNLLHVEEFNKIMNHFQFSQDHFVQQINHYFDTVNFDLKKHGCALRIREKNNSYEMTLKEPHSDGLLETNQLLTATEAQDFLNGGPIKEGDVRSQISALGIDWTKLIYFGTLTTDRAEFPYQNGLLVLDKSSYLNTEDYEIEYEVINREQGEPIFLNLLSALNIPVRQTKNKIQRFYEEKRRRLAQLRMD